MGDQTFMTGAGEVGCAVCGLPLDDHWLGTCPETADPACGPITWDGEPVYCRETIQEGLFDRSAFEQMRGQMALEAPANGERCYCPDDCNCRKPWRANYCGCRRH